MTISTYFTIPGIEKTMIDAGKYCNFNGIATLKEKGEDHKVNNCSQSARMSLYPTEGA